MAEASYAGAPDFSGEICVEEDSENDDESVVDPIPDDLFAIYNNLFDSSDDLSDFRGLTCQKTSGALKVNEGQPAEFNFF